MPISVELRQQVRQRANFCCEFCGVSETDVGGELTIDHFQPKSKGGGDDLDNLIYCCHRCNEHKSDYWPTEPTAPLLWNPRAETPARHFMLLNNGRLAPLTPTGEFTAKRLHLNRQGLIEHRSRKLAEAEIQQQALRYEELARNFAHLQNFFLALLEHNLQLQRQAGAVARLNLKVLTDEEESNGW